MANFSALPRDILGEIISHVTHGFKDLLSCSRVCKSISEAANAALYDHVNFSREYRYDATAEEKTSRRQARLLLSLSENSRLGALVHIFTNSKTLPVYGHPGDSTMRNSIAANVLVGAAHNMRLLRKAFFMPSEVAAYIIANLGSYSQLVDLTIYGLAPEENIWKLEPVSLRKLTWTVPLLSTRDKQHPSLRNSVSMLVNVVESTCPSLEYLDISFSQLRGYVPTKPKTSSDLPHQYIEMKSNDRKRLSHLRHIGVRHEKSGVDMESEVSIVFLELVERYAHSLNSVAIPVCRGPWTQEKLDYVMKVCMLLTGLKSLSLPDLDVGLRHSTAAPHPLLIELITKLGDPIFQIERFSILNIETSFSASFGTLFRSWSSLRYLRIGDGDNSEGPFGEDGRPQFDDYRSEVLGFIKALPPSLEELYIELNGYDLCCDDDEDFDPMCDLGPEIFGTLRRLHTCDIHAWISNIDGGLGQIPEKCVCYRRQPHFNGDPYHNKDLWTSRMDCIYQEDDPRVKKSRHHLFLGQNEEPFMGKDADGIWLDGYTFDPSRLRGTRRGAPLDRPDTSWPFYVDKISSYGDFRDRNG